MGCKSGVLRILRGRAAPGVHACSFGAAARYASAGRNATVVPICSSIVVSLREQLREYRLYRDTCVRWRGNHCGAPLSRAGSPLGYLDRRIDSDCPRRDRGGHSSAISVGVPWQRSAPIADSSCLPCAHTACGVSKSMFWRARSWRCRSRACDTRGRRRCYRHNGLFMRFLLVLAIPWNQASANQKGRTKRWSRFASRSSGVAWSVGCELLIFPVRGHWPSRCSASGFVCSRFCEEVFFRRWVACSFLNASNVPWSRNTCLPYRVCNSSGCHSFCCFRQQGLC